MNKFSKEKWVSYCLGSEGYQVGKETDTRVNSCYQR
jgi:hypothetical protein